MVKIYSQGDLDGACFLYSIANAYRTLSNKEISPSAWSKALKWVCFPEDLLNRSMGTERYNNKTELYQLVINSVLAELSYYQAEHVKISKLDNIRKLITDNSVAIFCYRVVNDKGKEIINHWTCGVDYTVKPFGIQIACSDCSATPLKSSKYNRWYNEVRADDNITELFDFTVFKIYSK